MADQSHIEWTDSTWNPITGCTKVSPGCKFCYAERMARRLQAMGQPNYINGFKVSLHEHVLDQPLRWRKPQVIFVNSMSDLFHVDIPVEFLMRVFDVMNRADQHRYQILTKRSERLAELASALPWAPHIWMGVSIESDDYTWRAEHLRSTQAQIKFLSLEPLLGPLPSLDLAGIDWVIVGGESGAGARPMELEWARNLRDRCVDSAVPFFLKQLGGWPDKRGGEKALLDNRRHIEMPVSESDQLQQPGS